MRHSDFDKYIQQNASSHLTAPSDLDWDNMDIVLPKQKSNVQLKRYKALFTLIGVGLIYGIIYFFYSLENNQVAQQVISTEEQKSISSSKSLNVKDAIIETEISSMIISEDLLKNNSNEISSITFNPSSTKKHSIPKNKVNHKENIQDIYQRNETLNSRQDQDVDKDNITPQKTIQPTKNLLLQDENVFLLTTISLSNLSNITLFDLPKIELPKRKKQSKNTLAIIARTNYTQNRFQSSNLEYLNILREADLGGWSESILLRKSIALNHSFLLNLGGSYNRLHTIFSYSKYLGYEDIIENGISQRVHRTRVIYQNNYSNIVALNLGLGKSITITDKVNLNLNLGIQGGYVLEAKGKTLDTNFEVVYLGSFNRNKFTLSTTADLHLVYEMQHFRLLVGGGTSKFLTNLGSYDTSILTNQPSTFFIDIGIGKSF